MGNWLGRAFSFALVLVVLAWAAPAAQAEDVFLIVSLDPEGFDTAIDLSDDYGSPTIIVKIGSLTSGAPSPRETHFLPGEDPTIPLPPPEEGDDEFDLTALNGNESTIFGSFQTEEFDETEPHMVTPGATDVLPEIQAAVFAASGDLANAVALFEGFMRTGDIVEIVYDKAVELAGGSEGYLGPTPSAIAEALFGSTQPLSAPDAFSCEAEGELFPHKPDEVEPISAFEVAFDNDGNFTALDICFLVDAEVKESSVNLKKKGTVSVAIYSTDTFDSGDIDETKGPVEIGGVAAEEVHFSAKKATAQFDVQDLGLTSDTEEVTIRAILSDGSCIEATIPINVK